MSWFLKIKAYAIAAAGFLIALLGTYLWAKHQGKAQGSAGQIADDAQATLEAIKMQTDTRTAVEMQVNDLPAPKPKVTVPPDRDVQVVGTADPATAAGQLQDWVRKS